jgi:glucose/arabinose dehydrogenase
MSRIGAVCQPVTCSHKSNSTLDRTGARWKPALLLVALSLLTAPFTSWSVTQTQVSSEKGQLTIETVVEGLKNPWALAFLPDEGVLITERPGTLRYWSSANGLSEPIQGVPSVYSRSQGGLLDVVLAPDFPDSRHVYLSYAQEGSNGRAGTAVGYGKLSADHTSLENFKIIFTQEPKLSTGTHFGSRLVFDRAGDLFIALGENNQRSTSQELDKLQGKLVRVHADGRVPDDNPFVAQKQAKPEIWSYGHRNQQGAALNPWSNKIWTHEHGPRGGDEINIPEAGKNYGWPLATHGLNYSGAAIPEALGDSAPDTEPPLYVWEASPAISGMAFYNAQRFPAWQKSLFIGALKDRLLIRLELDGDNITHEERLLEGLNERVRDVRVGTDGYVYVLTDSAKGKLLKVGLAD